MAQQQILKPCPEVRPCPVVAGNGKPASADGPVAVAARDIVYEIDGARLVDGVNVAARRGEFIGLIGPNGAGKTTLLKTIAGLLRQREGTVWLEGNDLAGLSPAEIARTMAVIPQLAPFTFGFTALEVVLMGRYPHMDRFQVEGDAERRAALNAMRLTETEAFAQRPVSTLSGGERQRVFVARALAQEPRVLLLDEPTANLDVQYQLKVLDLVSRLTRDGVTAIAAVHDLPLAARYCHRLVLLARGRVVADGLAHEVLTPANIEAAFGVRAVVYPDPLTGALTVSLVGPRVSERKAAGGARVHVVCGGGSGARVMYELRSAGYEVTACVLGAGDTDRRAADILGVSYVPTPPFGEIDDDVFEAHRALAKAADIVVLCETPFGRNNIRNLEAVADREHFIAVETGPFDRRDYTGGKARALYDSLPIASRCATPEAVVDTVAALVPESVGTESRR
ncbi:MAG: ABC transporter ATP-binding protein [Chloroflexi bacterium]|nr:ABC transporter ATP-binding protein [Chloroflexota bacterium]